MMRQVIRILIWCLLITGCTKTVYLEREKVVEVHEYVTKKDTVYIPKVERETVEVVKDIRDTSRLSTKYATSEAFVSDGELYHSLWNRPDAFKFDVEIPTFHRDSIIRIREPYPVEVVKEVRVVPTIYKMALWLVIGEILIVLLYIIMKGKKIV